jgi:hypothetical protein
MSVTTDELAEQVRQLAERVTRLEAGSGQSAQAPPRGQSGQAWPPTEPGLAAELVGRLGSGQDTVVYAGAGRCGEETLAWQREHDWTEVRQRVDDGTARVLSALGSTIRLRIVGVLVAGPATTAELTGQLDQPSTGQLFHHLKELLTAGLVHQPVRGTYAVRRQDVIPLLALLAAGTDLAASGGSMEPA